MYNINRRKFLGYFGCGCCSLVLPSCSTVPITDRKQLSIIPESRINNQAAAAYEQFRSKTKLIKEGDPVFLCFCGMTNFHKFKLGFDRTFWLKEIIDKTQIKTYETAVKSQQAALDVLGPGVMAEEVHAAYADFIQSAGYPYPTFRCGRATGFSMLEEPQLVAGNQTILQPGMVFAVDGSANEENFRAQVGDSFIITNDGYEQITHFSKEIEDVII